MLDTLRNLHYLQGDSSNMQYQWDESQVRYAVC